MQKTNIEWVKNPDGTQGYTWNPITGCLNHNNGLCKGGGFPCYAYKLANGRLRQRYLANDNIALVEGTNCLEAEKDPFYPRFWEDRLYEPVNKIRRWGRQSQVLHTQEPKGIFVCDMGELFGDWVPEEWTRQVLSTIKYQFLHRFYLLTKQPQNLAKWSPFPDNCWVGVTVTTNGDMTKALTSLANIKAKVRFISFEPLLGSIGMKDHMSMRGIVEWLIIGAQTKPYKPPKVEWVGEIVKAADQAGIPVFLKDNLLELVNYQSPKTEFAFNKDGYYRQEMPK